MMRLFKQLAVAVDLAVSVMSVQAAPTIVTSWSYGLSSLFMQAQPGGVTGVGTDTLSWGTPTTSGQSSLVIGNNPIVGGLATTFIGGGLIPSFPYWAPGNSITHNNNPITGVALTSAVLTSTLNLTALLPPPTLPGTPGALPPLIVNIGFAETPNVEPCVVTSLTPCNDIFVLVGGLLNQMFSYDVDGTGAVNYFLNVFPSTGGVLGTLLPAQCGAAGQDSTMSCIGFTTPENASTTLGFSFTISTQPFVIPEPGSLALAAVALLAAWMIRRRRYES